VLKQRGIPRGGMKGGTEGQRRGEHWWAFHVSEGSPRRVVCSDGPEGPHHPKPEPQGDPVGGAGRRGVIGEWRDRGNR
jgi:hypothetical protein